MSPREAAPEGLEAVLTEIERCVPIPSICGTRTHARFVKSLLFHLPLGFRRHIGGLRTLSSACAVMRRPRAPTLSSNHSFFVSSSNNLYHSKCTLPTSAGLAGPRVLPSGLLSQISGHIFERIRSEAPLSPPARLSFVVSSFFSGRVRIIAFTSVV